MTDIKCKFKYLCPNSWEDLEHSENSDVRFCKHCETDVYRARDEDDFNSLARQDKCVAYGDSGIVYMGEPEPIPLHYFVEIPEQDLSNSQISNLKKIIEPELSDEEVMLKYDGTKRVIDIGNYEDARLVWKKLKGISVESHLNSKKLTRK
ncbi:MAG: hypothetical protein ABJI60_11755 [Kangiellaceae bacterium]